MMDQKCLITNDTEELAKNGIPDVCAAIGIFDGVHLGHQAILAQLVRMAKRQNSCPVVITFAPHPRAVLDPGHAPPLLLPPEVKMERLAEHGVRAIVVLPFDETLAEMEAETFLDCYFAKNGLCLYGLCVGSRFRCGKDGRGTADVLAAYASRNHFEFQSVQEVRIDGTTVSSSEIRKAAAAGNLEKVSQFLGGPDTLYGYVEAGHGIAGRDLNAPTANLHLQYGVLPPNGVYAAETVLDDGRCFGSAVNIGTAPTYSGQMSSPSVRTEIHLLDFQGDVYDRKIRVELRQRIRPEIRFASTEELKQQIRKDIEQIKLILSRGGRK